MRSLKRRNRKKKKNETIANLLLMASGIINKKHFAKEKEK